MAKKKEEWLRYYATYFNTVEINSTFYRPPNEFLVNGWIKKGLGLRDFEYSVKMPAQVTHEALASKEGEKAGIQASAFEATCVKPLADHKLLGAVLIQLSPYFHHDSASVDALRQTLEALDTDMYSYAVEFRHRSWLDGKGKLDLPVAQMLAGFNVANVIVDAPGFPVVRDCTADHAYLRFHGRNYDLWFDEDSEEDVRHSRYDYLYSNAELADWRDAIVKLSGLMKTVRVYFNNNGKAKGPKNALQLMDMLSIPHREKEIAVMDQATLGSFLMNRT
jgi:uncharacterized protein YecE (DUF72 family)